MPLQSKPPCRGNRLFDANQARSGRLDADTWILDQAFPATRSTPMVTLLDGHPHTLAFLAGIDTDAIVRAALDVIG